MPLAPPLDEIWSTMRKLRERSVFSRVDLIRFSGTTPEGKVEVFELPRTRLEGRLVAPYELRLHIRSYYDAIAQLPEDTGWAVMLHRDGTETIFGVPVKVER